MLRNSLIILSALTVAACDPLPSVVPESVKEAACPLIRTQAEPMLEDALSNDWPVFAPMFATTGTPASDEAYCRDVISERGAFILPGESHGMAIRFVVLIPADFDERSPASRAALMCHEAAHIVRQMNKGVARAAVEYITPWGRLAFEFFPYALGDEILERHGVNPARRQVKREARFPARYKLTNTVTPECTAEFAADARKGLREVGGV